MIQLAMPAGGLPPDSRIECAGNASLSHASQEKLGRGQEIVPWDLPPAPGEEMIDLAVRVVGVVTHPRVTVTRMIARIRQARVDRDRA